jgi:tRNA threonylcarbamoyladenosine biosynthesis protein TsaE
VEIFLKDRLATSRIGALLAQSLEEEKITGPLLITLQGDLGTGKTTFCQGFSESLGANPSEIISPTFTLANEYEARQKIFHLDLYRLEARPLEEFLEAGLEEYLRGLCLVEWPDRLPDDFWPPERLELNFSYQLEGRLLKGRAHSLKTNLIWEKILKTELF